MKKIKKRRPSGRTWQMFALDAPASFDVAGLATLLVAVDAATGQVVADGMAPRPARPDELVEFIRSALQNRALVERPKTIVVESDALRDALAPLPGLTDIAIAVSDLSAVRQRMRSALKDAPVEQLSTRSLVGTRHLARELAQAARPLVRLRPWEVMREADVLHLVVGEEDAALRYPVVIVLGSAGSLFGVQLLSSFEDLEHMEELGLRAVKGLSWNADAIDSVSLWVLDEEEVGGLAAEAMRRQELALADDAFFSVLAIRGRDAAELEDRKQVAEVLRSLQALGAAFEQIHARGSSRERDRWPPFALWNARVTLPDGTDVSVVSTALEDELVEGEYARAEQILASKPEKILRMHIALDETQVWRRVDVPDNLTLAALHDVIQRVMGWRFEHLWEFRHKQTGYSIELDEFGPRTEDAYLTTIFDVLGPRGKTLHYLYDFGDSWHHSLRVERRFAPEPGVSYPRLVDGERAGPPEDCGGVWGFARLVEGDPHRRAWYGARFDPDAFDPATITLSSGDVLNRLYLELPTPEFDEAQLEQDLSVAYRLVLDAFFALVDAGLKPALCRRTSPKDQAQLVGHLEARFGHETATAQRLVSMIRWAFAIGGHPAHIFSDLQRWSAIPRSPTLTQWLKRIPASTLDHIGAYLGLALDAPRRPEREAALRARVLDPTFLRELYDRRLSPGARSTLDAFLGASEPSSLTAWLEQHGVSADPLTTAEALTLGPLGELYGSALVLIGERALDGEQRLVIAVPRDVRDALADRRSK
ncbi:MAG: plasmid pRiA4b ORF-3 family protein [Bradymonadaceae bacterium]|nr:plasmid pRiA4b ORF-3 family protein [Lujinxingiaceae bacterium]